MGMKGICETCTHWTKATESWRIKPEMLGKVGWCDCDKFSYTDEPEEGDETRLIYWDAEDYEAEFMTGAEFGCRFWSDEE